MAIFEGYKITRHEKCVLIEKVVALLDDGNQYKCEDDDDGRMTTLFVHGEFFSFVAFLFYLYVDFVSNKRL